MEGKSHMMSSIFGLAKFYASKMESKMVGIGNNVAETRYMQIFLSKNPANNGFFIFYQISTGFLKHRQQYPLFGFPLVIPAFHQVHFLFWLHLFHLPGVKQVYIKSAGISGWLDLETGNSHFCGVFLTHEVDVEELSHDLHHRIFF